MRRYLKVLAGLASVLVVFGVVVVLKNRDTRWDAGQAIVSPGSVTEPRVGVIIVALSQPSQYAPRFWNNISKKILDTVIPWPINIIAGRDKGVVLVDPARPGAMTSFSPVRLLDIEGNEKDRDGIPWVEKFRKGEVKWVAPSETISHDIGYFLYADRKQGMATSIAKTNAKARYLYHAGLKNGYLPHGDQTKALGEGTAALVMAQHPQVVAAEFADAFDYPQKEAAVRRVLDSGVDVLVLGSGQPIYSDFEELRGAFSGIYEIVTAWEAEHPGKKVRIAVAPWMGSVSTFDQLWLDHFAATVPPATGPGQKAMGIFSLHGLPVSLAKSDSWSKRWPLTFARMKPRMATILREKGYTSVRVEAGSEVFADLIEDPDNELTSVNELYKQAIAGGYTLAIAIPVEFLAENTDTLFAHQASFFDGIGGYKSYSPPPLDQDWQKPYVRTLKQGGTTVIYAGTPGGAARPRADAALADAIGRVFPK